jgi:hypothetical protein
VSGKSVNLISFDCVETCILGYVQWRIFVIEWEWQKCKFDIYMIQLFFSKKIMSGKIVNLSDMIQLFC